MSKKNSKIAAVDMLERAGYVWDYNPDSWRISLFHKTVGRKVVRVEINSDGLCNGLTFKNFLKMNEEGETK